MSSGIGAQVRRGYFFALLCMVPGAGVPLHKDNSADALGRPPCRIQVPWPTIATSVSSSANQGVDAILGVLSTLDSAGVTVTPEAIAVGNGSVTAWLREQGKRDDVELDVHVALVITLRDNKVAALTGPITDVAAYDAFLAE